eukprot:1256755-Rhodomonas_salina.1
MRPHSRLQSWTGRGVCERVTVMRGGEAGGRCGEPRPPPPSPSLLALAPTSAGAAGGLGLGRGVGGGERGGGGGSVVGREAPRGVGTLRPPLPHTRLSPPARSLSPSVARLLAPSLEEKDAGGLRRTCVRWGETRGVSGVTKRVEGGSRRQREGGEEREAAQTIASLASSLAPSPSDLASSLAPSPSDLSPRPTLKLRSLSLSTDRRTSNDSVLSHALEAGRQSGAARGRWQRQCRCAHSARAEPGLRAWSSVSLAGRGSGCRATPSASAATGPPLPPTARTPVPPSASAGGSARSRSALAAC